MNCIIADHRSGLVYGNGKSQMHIRYTPLISRVQGPYGKLWTEFFFLLFMAQARSTRAIKSKEGKNEEP